MSVYFCDYILLFKFLNSCNFTKICFLNHILIFSNFFVNFYRLMSLVSVFVLYLKFNIIDYSGLFLIWGFKITCRFQHSFPFLCIWIHIQIAFYLSIPVYPIDRTSDNVHFLSYSIPYFNFLTIMPTSLNHHFIFM